jgi:hypothetical protein
MKKIIWGIAAVFCVQVGFQLAMTAERSENDYAALSTPLQNSVADVNSAAIDPSLLDTSVSYAEKPVYAAAETSRRRIRIPNAVQYREARTSPRIGRDPLRTMSTTASFKPVVITYDRSGALTESQAFARKDKPAATVKPQNDVDKRSLIARIVTKPYDWLKAVGSKLR